MKTPSGATIAVFARYSAARSKRGSDNERRLLRWMGRSADAYWHRRAFVKVAATVVAGRQRLSVRCYGSPIQYGLDFVPPLVVGHRRAQLFDQIDAARAQRYRSKPPSPCLSVDESPNTP